MVRDRCNEPIATISDELSVVVNLYMIIFDAIVKGKPIASGSDGHYIAENGNVCLGDFFAAIAKALYELGALKTPEVAQFPPEYLEEVVRYPILDTHAPCLCDTDARELAIIQKLWNECSRLVHSLEVSWLEAGQ